MLRLWLKTVFAWDRARFAVFVRRYGERLRLEPPVSPHLRQVALRIESGARVWIGPGFTTERRRANHVWVQAGGELVLGRSCWLRTECGENRLTVFPGARLQVGARALLNGAMLHAKRDITIGDDAMIGFGSRLLDADGHPLDLDTPERVKPIRIGDRVWIGSDVTILPGVTIGDDVVIAARSVVTRDVPPRSLALGIPAKPVREIGRRETLPEAPDLARLGPSLAG